MIEYLKKLYPRGTKLGTDQKSNLEDTFLLMKVKPKNTYFLLEVKSRMSAKQQARVELMSQELWRGVKVDPERSIKRKIIKQEGIHPPHVYMDKSL